MTEIDRLPEGYRIRRVARAIEARRNAERAHIAARVRSVASEARERATFDAATLAWFRRPLGALR